MERLLGGVLDPVPVVVDVRFAEKARDFQTPHDARVVKGDRNYRPCIGRGDAGADRDDPKPRTLPSLANVESGIGKVVSPEIAVGATVQSKDFLDIGFGALANEQR